MSRYPSITAGQKLTADLLNSMLPQFVYKAANTERSSTTTVSSDPDLQISLEAGTYFVEFFLIAGGVTASDIKTAWSTPSGSSGLKSVVGPGSTATDANADNISMRSGVHGFATEITYSGVRNATNQVFRIYEHGVVTVTTAGTLALQWAQATSGATASRIGAGSLMRVTQIA